MPISQFGEMCAKLGIELIGANSAQAKGRVERGHGTHQDRLIKKMRLKKIATYAETNAYLGESYLEGHNARYAVAPREKADFHVSPGKRQDLNQVFCLEEEHKVSNDWVIQYGRRWLQIEEDQKVLVGAGSTVAVRQHRDGSLTLLRAGQQLRWHELAERPKAKERVAKRKIVRRVKPAAEHPWRKALLAGHAN